MKTMTIASGKGGAGKTTLAALLSLRATEEMQTVLADADVEASNLPLALDARVQTRESFEGGLLALIDNKRCIACGNCVKVCRFDAVSFSVLPSGSHRYDVDPWACEGCTLCARICPVNAIQMKKGTAGDACSGKWDGGTIAWGELAPGEDLSGKLVTEVRRTASQSAEESGAELILVDGPPGVGCPTIAALADTDLLVAVTEPTVSGEHDLARLLDLAESLGIGAVVVLNKSDLSEPGAASIRSLCEQRAVALVAEVPFDTTLAEALDTMTSEGLASSKLADVAHSSSIDALWESVRSRLSFG